MEQVIKVSVRSLVEFALKSGSIDSGFSGSMKAVEGTKGHRLIQKSRGEGYEAEVPIAYTITRDNITIEISGRIDGIYTEENRVVIEEIKTTERVLEDLDEEYNPVHWAQAKCYAYIYCVQNDIDLIDVKLTYFHRENRGIKEFVKSFEITDLEQFFNFIIEKYFKWARIIGEWKDVRNVSIEKLIFPFSNYRKGQRELAVAVYKTICEERKLFARAPTGIGKTMATIFPAVKALGEGKISRIFYLTARNIGRNIAEDAFENLRRNGLKLKTVILTAKEKICINDKMSCKPEDCEFARGYFDRVDNAIEDALEIDSFTLDSIIRYAKKHNVCPFEFSLDLSLFCDGIICDYNYVYDPRVYLKRFFNDVREDYAFLIDEAHNLVDRAREMYSADIWKRKFLELKKGVKDFKELKKNLNEINSYFIRLRKRLEENEYIVQSEPLEDIYVHIRNFIDLSEGILSRSDGLPFKEELLELYFESMNFIKISDLYDDKYVTYIEKDGNDVRLRLFCQDPSRLLEKAGDRGQSSIFFSATLSPIEYFINILGGNEKDYRIKISSPFNKENLCVMAADNIETSYKKRELTYNNVAESIYSMISHRKGNYIVFFPSYKYLNEVFNIFTEKHPLIKTIRQNNTMSEIDREEFLNEFSNNNEESLIGFAVMGGVFGEGIDLTGDRLIGAVIVGVGLPQVCLERDIIREFFQKEMNEGFEYAYVYPGINKVLQAAGRVIRTENDRGIVLLIDERFSRSNYRKLLPGEWNPIHRVKNSDDISKVVTEFWNK